MFGFRLVCGVSKSCCSNAALPRDGAALLNRFGLLFAAANHDQQLCIDIVRRALRAPTRQIAEYAGEDGIAGIWRPTDEWGDAYSMPRLR
jgi:hypothetical protein